MKKKRSNGLNWIFVGAVLWICTMGYVLHELIHINAHAEMNQQKTEYKYVRDIKAFPNGMVGFSYFDPSTKQYVPVRSSANETVEFVFDSPGPAKFYTAKYSYDKNIRILSVHLHSLSDVTIMEHPPITR